MAIYDGRLIVTLWASLFFLAAGCGDSSEPERRVVEGTVSFAGKPIEAGEIRFVPLTEGPVSAGLITNGKYKVAHRGGVVLGEVQVQIIATGSDMAVTQEQLDAVKSMPRPVAIPPKYNTHSELRATVQPGEGSQRVDFDLLP